VSASTVRGSAGRERAGVLSVAALIVVTIAVYLALRSTALETPGGGLLPYQALVGTLVSTDQDTFADLYRELAEIEVLRAANGRWPEASSVRSLPSYTWTSARDGYFVNYLARPSGDVSAAGWLLVFQEPDPQAPPDTAPNDETHHRLPDGTVLHVSVWTHAFGGQLSPTFVRQPEGSGWTQVLRAPAPPVRPAGTR
jgi:hypothetical protein